jgi:hypothetical protein
MADKSMKASIQVDMDAKGVAKGVAATNRELDKLNRTARRASMAASISAGIDILQLGAQGIQSVMQLVQRRMEQLNTAAVTFNGQAAIADAQSQMDRMAADIRIGAAVAPGSSQSSLSASEIAAGEADRIERNAAGINAGMGAASRFGQNFGSIMNITGEGLGALVAAVEARMNGDLQGADAGRRQAMDLFGELINPTNYAFAPSTTSARGMPYDPQMAQQNRLLESIDRKQGGQ